MAGRVRVIERARSGGEATSNVQALRSLLLLDKPSGVTLRKSRALLGCGIFANQSGYRFCRTDKGQEARSNDEVVTMLRRLCYWPRASRPDDLLRSICAER